MNRRMIIRSKAKLDIAEAVLWYAQKRHGLGDEFLAAVRGRLDRVLVHPASFPIVARKCIRRALVDRFPYAIYFVETAEGLAVLAVFHTSRDHRRLLRNRH
jgi:toxin ParE1/3/4